MPLHASSIFMFFPGHLLPAAVRAGRVGGTFGLPQGVGSYDTRGLSRTGFS